MTPLKLLVVEDDPASLELMSEVFTSLKAEVRAVNDSEKAVGIINQERFDGIFLDLEMPNLHRGEQASQSFAYFRPNPIAAICDPRFDDPSFHLLRGLCGRVTLSRITERRVRALDPAF